MSDAGGQITHLGVLYQDKIAALYLGRMIDPRAINLPSDQQVVEVRGEKPGADVDDIYVRFADRHCLYIQAKTALQDSGDTWKKLWRHFYNQHRRKDFGADDRLELLMGDYAKWYKDLRTICENASSSTSLEEWQLRHVSGVHKDLAKKLAKLIRKIVWEQEKREDLPPDEPDFGDYQRLKTLLSCVDLRFIENKAIESDQLIYWMPESNNNLESLFNSLCSLVTKYASHGRTFEIEELRHELDRLGVTIKPLEQQSELLPALLDQDKMPAAQEDLPSGSHLPFLRNHFDIYILCSEFDEVIVEELAVQLEDCGEEIKVWFDKWYVVPGEFHPQQSNVIFKSGKSYAIFLGEHTPIEWFKSNLKEAIETQKSDSSILILPVLLPNAKELNKDDYPEIRTWIDFRGGIDEYKAFRLLVSGIKRVPPGKPPSIKTSEYKNNPVYKDLYFLKRLRDERIIDETTKEQYTRDILDKWVGSKE